MIRAFRNQASVAVLVSAIVFGSLTVAHADGDDVEEIASLVTGVTGGDNLVVAVEEADSVALSSGEVVVDLPADPGQLISVSNEGVLPVLIGLPNETVTEEVELASDGTAVYEGTGNSADVTAQVLETGLRFTTVIADSSQADRFTYPVGGDATPVLNTDGSVSVLKPFEATDPETGEKLSGAIVVADIAAPWALDAAGNEVATHFEVSDGAVVQVVEHDQAGVVFPVIADPQITILNAFQTRIRWNRAETKTIASAGWGATGLTAVCAAAGMAVAGPPAAAAFAAACLLISGSGVYTAGVAQNSNPKRCLQLTITNTIVTSPVPWFSTYPAGGYCR